MSLRSQARNTYGLYLGIGELEIGPETNSAALLTFANQTRQLIQRRRLFTEISVGVVGLK